MRKDFEAKMSQNISKISQIGSENKAEIVVESGAKIRQFGGYNVLIIQDNAICMLEFGDESLRVLALLKKYCLRMKILTQKKFLTTCVRLNYWDRYEEWLRDGR